MEHWRNASRVQCHLIRIKARNSRLEYVTVVHLAILWPSLYVTRAIANYPHVLPTCTSLSRCHWAASCGSANVPKGQEHWLSPRIRIKRRKSLFMSEGLTSTYWSAAYQDARNKAQAKSFGRRSKYFLGIVRGSATGPIGHFPAHSPSFPDGYRV